MVIFVRFKLEGDEQGWLKVDPDSGELKTKAGMDRETTEQLKVRIIAYETGRSSTDETETPPF